MYTYYSLKQLESDILDMSAALRKNKVEGIEVTEVTIDLSTTIYDKFRRECIDKMNYYISKCNNSSENTVEFEGYPDTSSEKGTRVMFGNIAIIVNRCHTQGNEEQ